MQSKLVINPIWKRWIMYVCLIPINVGVTTHITASKEWSLASAVTAWCGCIIYIIGTALAAALRADRDEPFYIKRPPTIQELEAEKIRLEIVALELSMSQEIPTENHNISQ